MLPTLKLGATGEIQLKDAYAILSEEFHLSEEDSKHLLSSVTYRKKE